MLVPGKGTEVPSAAQHSAERGRQQPAQWAGRAGQAPGCPPLPHHPLGGNLGLALRSLTSSDGTWYPLPMALLHLSTRHQIPHGNSHSLLWDLATHPSMHPDLLPSLRPSFSRGRASCAPDWVRHDILQRCQESVWTVLLGTFKQAKWEWETSWAKACLYIFSELVEVRWLKGQQPNL